MRLIFLVVALAFTGAASAQIEPLKAPVILENEGFQGFFAQVAPNVYLAGQPTEDAVAGLGERGIKTVINLRTDREVGDRSVVPFDEAEAMTRAGMTYIHLPQGGPDTPYSPASVAAFASALEQAEGDVLIHCTIAWRASHLWAAYLVEHQGYSVADAVEVGKSLNMGGFPFADFLGREISLAEEVSDDE